MKDIDFRKLQEAVADLIKMKTELATMFWELFEEFVNKGFTREEALELVMMMYVNSQGQSGA